jgi:hypothetical protein
MSSDRAERALLKAIRDATGGKTRIDAIRRALLYTAQAAGPMGDGRIGVLRFESSADKFAALLGYVALLPRQPDSTAPLLIVLAQGEALRVAFEACRGAFLYPPEYAPDRSRLRELLGTGRPLIVTGVAAFFPPGGASDVPLLSVRRNVILIADDLDQFVAIRGFPRLLRDALPNGRFVAFTGLPIETLALAEWDIRKIFGDNLHI